MSESDSNLSSSISRLLLCPKLLWYQLISHGFAVCPSCQPEVVWVWALFGVILSAKCGRVTLSCRAQPELLREVCALGWNVASSSSPLHKPPAAFAGAASGQ